MTTASPQPSLWSSGVAGGALFLYKQIVSPLLHAIGGASGACRFQPTCSEYAAVAIATHGVVRGTLLALRRLAKCHPFHPAQFDPVPAFMQSSARPSTIEETGFAPESTLPPAANPPHAGR